MVSASEKSMSDKVSGKRGTESKFIVFDLLVNTAELLK